MATRDEFANSVVGSGLLSSDDLKALYATAFEIDSAWLIEAASRRQKWIDQSQSLNLYIANPSGKKLDALYRHDGVRAARDHGTGRDPDRRTRMHLAVERPARQAASGSG